MFFCNNIARVALLLLLSAQASSIHALPAEGEANELIALNDVAAKQTTGVVPPAPPGPYFSLAMPKEMAKETAITQPVQMPASVSVSEQRDESVEQAAKAPVPAPLQNMEQSREEIQKQPNQKQSHRVYDIESTNPLAEWPRAAESIGESPRQWVPAPPAPPGPYGFVPNYTPRSAVNSAGRGYRAPYYPVNNAYGAPYGRSAPMMYPRTNSGYSNPGYYYGHPNQGGYNQGGFDQRARDQRVRQNNLNSKNMNSRNMNQRDANPR